MPSQPVRASRSVGTGLRTALRSRSGVARGARGIARWLAITAGVAIGVFHLYLFWDRLAAGDLLDPSIALRWLSAAGLVLALVLLRRFGSRSPRDARPASSGYSSSCFTRMDAGPGPAAGSPRRLRRQRRVRSAVDLRGYRPRSSLRTRRAAPPRGCRDRRSYRRYSCPVPHEQRLATRRPDARSSRHLLLTSSCRDSVRGHLLTVGTIAGRRTAAAAVRLGSRILVSIDPGRLGGGVRLCISSSSV